MSDIYQGDPKVTIDADGSDLTFKNGQPVMDRGLENTVLISLFTDKGWAGNTFFSLPNQKIGSDFEKTANQTITATSLNDIRNAGQKALQWMLEPEIASQVIVETSNTTGNILDIGVLIEPPGQELNILLLNKSGLNWIAQKQDPAYLKV